LKPAFEDAIVMTAKEQLLQEIEQAPDALIEAVLQYLYNAKVEQASLTSANPSSNPYPLQGKEPYRYNDPFEPATALEDWDASQ
jgi:hypothetical protein